MPLCKLPWKIIFASSGVPQGSVLGPLLFLIYVNDIPSYICHSSVYLFADDTKLLKVLKSSVDATNLQEDLNSLDCWSVEWLVCLNALKCSHISFSMSGKERTTEYSSNGTLISGASSYKDRVRSGPSILVLSAPKHIVLYTLSSAPFFNWHEKETLHCLDQVIF